jgi:hypothetical protein
MTVSICQIYFVQLCFKTNGMNTKLFVFIISSGILFYTANAQIQSWPPSGIKVSPVTSKMKLTGNRYVPSTKRYNLVWADQFYGLSAGKTEFMAKNYVATQKIFSYQADQFRAYNANFIVVSYHLSNGINPQKNDDCPDPKSNSGTGNIGVVAPKGYVGEWDNYFLPWLTKESISVGSNTYEQMFQHFSSVAAANRVWHSDPYWVMNLENANWQKYLSDICIDWMKGNVNEGCFLDVCVETMASSLFQPRSGDPDPYNFDWHISPHGPAGYTINNLSDFAGWMNNQYKVYFQSIYKRFHTDSIDYLVLPNVDQMVTGWYNPSWMDGDITNGETIDGAMMESFGGYTGADMFLTLDRCVKHITGRGKILLAQFYDSTQAERYRRTGMYMLVKNENSFINITVGSVNWFPEYEIDLGDQSALPADISNLRVAGSGAASLFRRDYQNGMVLCNTSGSAINYKLSGKNWYKIVTTGGGDVSDQGVKAKQSLILVPSDSTVTVPASGCLILKNTTPVPVLGSFNQDVSDNLFIFPNPVLDHFTIKTDFELKTDCFVTIVNSTGEELYRSSFHGLDHIIEIRNLSFPSGLYHVVVYSGKSMYHREIIILK